MPEKSDQEQILPLAEKMLAEARAEMPQADNKASILLAALGIATGVVAAGAIGGDWIPHDLANSVEWLWWIGAGCVAGAILAAAMAVFPRFDDSEPELATYWGHAAKANSEQRLEELLLGTAGDQWKRTMHQLLQVSRILHRKYTQVRWALWLAGVGAVLSLFAIFVD